MNVRTYLIVCWNVERRFNVQFFNFLVPKKKKVCVTCSRNYNFHELFFILETVIWKNGTWECRFTSHWKYWVSSHVPGHIPKFPNKSKNQKINKSPNKKSRSTSQVSESYSRNGGSTFILCVSCIVLNTINNKPEEVHWRAILLPEVHPQNEGDHHCDSYFKGHR